jgi:hypothetical protein
MIYSLLFALVAVCAVPNGTEQYDTAFASQGPSVLSVLSFLTNIDSSKNEEKWGLRLLQHQSNLCGRWRDVYSDIFY